MAFLTRVYDNVVRSNTQLADWSNKISNLSFSSAANSGFAECTFSIAGDFETLRDIVVGTTQRPSFVTNRIRITDETSFVNYEGMIHTLTLRYGGETMGASIDNLYTVARFNYLNPFGNLSWACANANRTVYGSKVFLQDVGAQFQSSVIPLNLATRHSTEHSIPSKPDTKTLGAAGAGVSLEVSCVGLAATLGFRYAFNYVAGATDTATIVSDMVTPGAVASGANAGLGLRGWVERLISSTAGASTDAGGTIPYRAQWLDTVYYSPTGVLVIPLSISSAGETRLEIIQKAMSYGNNLSYRTMFQVWEGLTNNGKGVGWVNVQSQTVGGRAGYSGYYLKRNVLLNAAQQRIPAYQVRAGQWLTDLNLSASSQTYGGGYATSPFTDPRAFWLEHVQYNAETGVLEMATQNEFNLSLYMGRMMSENTRVIGEAQ